MEEAKVPGGPVYSPQQTLDDPHINATNMMAAVDYPTLSQPARVMDFPVALSTTPGRIQRRAPELASTLPRCSPNSGTRLRRSPICGRSGWSDARSSRGARTLIRSVSGQFDDLPDRGKRV